MDSYADSYSISRPYKQFIDVSLAFEANPLTGDITVLKNERAINNSIKNIILSLPGETPFNYDMGSRVTGYLFENPDPGTRSLLSQEIRRAIGYNEPRAEIEDVQVNVDEDTGSIEARIEYKIVGYEKVIVFTQILEPTR